MTKTNIAPPGLAVIGCGAWGRNHVKTAAALGALRGVRDTNPDKASAAAAAAGVPTLGFDDILNDDAISGVIIATPDDSHSPLALDALNAGKHVFVEKPMATSVADAVRLVDLAKRNGRVLMAGHILLYHPGFLHLCGLVQGKALGEIRHITCQRLHLARRLKRHALWDLAPHDISMVLTLNGKLPTVVRAQAETPVPGVPPQLVRISLSFENAPSADISVSAIHPVKLHQITLAGSDAFAVFDDTRDWHEKVSVIRPGLGAYGRDDRPSGTAPALEAVALQADEPLKAEVRSFLDAIGGGPMPPSHGGEGLAVVQVLAAAEESLATGEAVSLDRNHHGALET
ncbi:MAG: Gfo/Idh/MocA family oxidoreductase [Alphaproteobacteria bacterium]|nr:Gfo/Idh/MocA family oxidoreductase [Alphaproteobacteria bacterium]